jgi:uncharacterized membrane protein YeiH
MLPISPSIFIWYDLGATFFWAVSGAMMGARRGYDVMGIFIVAMVSATGAGLLRDGLFLPVGLPVMVRTPDYLLTVAAGTAAVVLFGGWLRRQKRLKDVLTLTDALGMGAYAVVGMTLAAEAGVPFTGVILIGTLNAVGGGLLRDLLLGRTPELLKPSVLTGIASLLGCLLGTAVVQSGFDRYLAGAVTILCIVGIRMSAVYFDVRSRPLKAFEEDWRGDRDAGKSAS